MSLNSSSELRAFFYGNHGWVFWHGKQYFRQDTGKTGNMLQMLPLFLLFLFYGDRVTCNLEDACNVLSF